MSNVATSIVPLPTPEQGLAHFHVVNSVIQDGSEVVTVPPDMSAQQALALMREHGFSQVPVMKGKAILGVFSYRAFALEVADGAELALDLPVEEFLNHDKPVYVLTSETIIDLIDVLDRSDSLLVSGPDELIAIVTPMDVLTYLHRVAESFVLIGEIELSLRKLIDISLPDLESFQTCVRNGLEHKYNDKLPASLASMTFDDYVAILRHDKNWKNNFKSVFGGTRNRARGKLEGVRKIRNDVFHFRPNTDNSDRDALVACRNWLHLRIRIAQATPEDS